MENEKPVLNREELKEKLYNLEKQLKEVDGMRKSMAKDYREQIADIRGEIKDTIDLIDGIVGG